MAASLQVVACALSGTTPADLSPAGVWEGEAIVRGSRLAMTLKIARDSAGLSGWVTAPDQYALDYRLLQLRSDSTTLRGEFPPELFPGAFEATLEAGRLIGRFSAVVQGDSVDGVVELWRRPASTPPYRAQEVRFSSGELMLAGTALIPEREGRHPGVVLLHGSGPQTRESYLRYFPHRFASAGFAALIYDKRGTGESGGARWPRTAGGFAELAEDGSAAVRYLAGRPDVDPERIGLWGLSQGAWIAPLTAARSGQAAFVIMLSGGGVRPAEQELYDDEIRLRDLGYSEEQIGDAIAYLSLADDYIRSASDDGWARFERAREASRDQPWYPHLDRFPQVLPREAPVWAGLRADLDYDPRPILERLGLPLLVLLADEDRLTPTRETARRIEEALRRAGNRDYRIVILPGADHALTIEGEPGRSWSWRRLAPGWIEEMLAWARESLPQ